MCIHIQARLCICEVLLIGFWYPIANDKCIYCSVWEHVIWCLDLDFGAWLFKLWANIAPMPIHNAYPINLKAKRWCLHQKAGNYLNDYICSLYVDTYGTKISYSKINIILSYLIHIQFRDSTTAWDFDDRYPIDANESTLIPSGNSICKRKTLRKHLSKTINWWIHPTFKTQDGSY